MKKFGFCLDVVLVAACLAGAQPHSNAATKDEKEIRALEDSFAAAFRAKDVGAIMRGYAPGKELLVFDVIPPRQYLGFDAYKKDWQTSSRSSRVR